MYRAILTLFFVVECAVAACAQKLPNVQQGSARAPKTVKIDGKASEWEFKAYNKATEIFYTIANDEDNLYLVVRAVKTEIINKLIGGGLTISLGKSTGKRDTSTTAVTFPAYEGYVFQYINRNLPTATSDTLKNKSRADSFLHAINKQLIVQCKEIGIVGLPGIAETRISLYNELGIKAAALFDDNYSYVYELALPLKYLDKNTLNQGRFKYRIVLNGATANGASVAISSSGRFIDVGLNGKRLYSMINDAEGMSKAFPTDFSGEYTLAKK